MYEVDKQLDRFRRVYRNSRKPIRVSFRELCRPWNWAKRSDAYTHFLHRYPAKILPYIPIYFLSSEEYASTDETVLDPFCGTGTVLLESIVHPYLARNAVGVEINPLARLIAKVKTTPQDTSELRAISSDLLDTIERFSGQIHVPDFSNRDLWFSKHVQEELTKIRLCIEEVHGDDCKDFFLASFSSIIRDVSFADPKIAPPVILRVENFAKNGALASRARKLIRAKRRANPLRYFQASVERNIRRVETLNKVQWLRKARIKSKVVWDDARVLKQGRIRSNGRLDKGRSAPIPNNSIGLVITSPPYINAQKYVRTTKFEIFWLGMADEHELTHLSKSTIGTEAVYCQQYKDLTLTGVASADRVIEKIYKIDRQKAFIVAKYFLDMETVFREVHRVLRPGGRFVVVIGDNSVRGVKVENHRILRDIACQDGLFREETVLVDEIRSRGMITKRHETGGLLLDEWVIVLRKEG